MQKSKGEYHLKEKNKAILICAVILALAAVLFICRLPASLVFPELCGEAEQSVKVRIDRGGAEQPVSFTITDAETATAIIEMLSSLRLTPLAPSQIVTYGEAGIIDLWVGSNHIRINDLGDVHSDTVRFFASKDKLAGLIAQLIAAQP